VYVYEPGILETLHVRDGQYVEKGELLADFRSLDLENQMEEAGSEHKIRVVQLDALREQAKQTTDPLERAKVEAAINKAGNERAMFAQRVERFEARSHTLHLRAPRAGVVMSPPHLDEVGRPWDKDQATPFCTIGDPTRLRALIPVSTADYNLLKEDLAADPGLAVTIRVQGRATHVWQGRIESLPESEAREVPFQLTAKGGGPLAVKPSAQPNVYVPQNQQYLVPIDFRQTDNAICPGTLAQVKIHCRWRTGGWWLWRAVSSTFDLGLI
jgi:putative peptide zinc metalloprotease protein